MSAFAASEIGLSIVVEVNVLNIMDGRFVKPLQLGCCKEWERSPVTILRNLQRGLDQSRSSVRQPRDWTARHRLRLPV